MFSPEELKRILQESDVIKNVSIIKEAKLFENVYQTVLQGELVINERESFVVYIAVPEKWYRDLVDIYVADYNELVYMPHIDNKGKLCLFETEGILIDQNLPGIMMQSLLRAQTILKQGFSGENKNDFINEFELYWAQLKDCRIAHLAVETDRKNRIVKGGIKKSSKRKKEKQIEYIKRCKKAPIYIGENVESLKRWNLEKTPVMNIAYFVIYSEKYIFPPDIRKKLSIDYLNALLHFVPEGELASIMPRSRQDRIVVFEIHQPSGQTHLVGMYIKGGMLKETSLEKVEELQPLLMERADKKFLMKRVTEQDSENYKNRILIIGCGSIGGHVICELAKAGYEDLTIVDYEKLTEENIFRHVLGMEYVNRYKCEALNTYIQKNIPESVMGVCALVLYWILHETGAYMYNDVLGKLAGYCETLVSVSVIMMAAFTTGSLSKVRSKSRKVFVFENFSKPMQLVVTAVVAFGGAAVIKLVLVYFFGL